jgi:hypothetical protein
MKINKKGVESEGIRFNTDQAAILIIFLILLAILIILIFVTGGIGSEKFHDSVFNFGKSIYDTMVGGGGGKSLGGAAGT